MSSRLLEHCIKEGGARLIGKFEATPRSYISILLKPYFMWGGALDRSDVLLSYLVMALA